MSQRSLAPQIITGLGLMLLTGALLRQGVEWAMVDVCLDGGGAYDYARAVCREPGYSAAIPSLWQRNPAVVLLASSGTVLALLGAGLIYLSRRGGDDES
ncbi:hypothetical protein GCM10007907_02100 [Chitinimonas prasina]|uniref:Uncharacterized protein n=1 Tax=Chitinimonas prasina TaxID=1434937 RepID=A0ABQ5Y904_9NEIS|nr:hypothetical protein [Chitinimonas prasina]GLR11420.1 hypothetical protein GCM10007907_02100 [Chitinimonas prasina]